VDRYERVTDELHKIYLAKNADYGNSFEITNDMIGEVAAVTRCFDKVMRLVTLSKQSANVNESIRDTWSDLANYAIMQLMYIDSKGDAPSYCKAFKQIDETVSKMMGDM